jgi:orotidine-5'-phosphate decarboxylase
VFDWATEFNQANGTTVGLVVGATIGQVGQQVGIDFSTFNGPILAPGVGAQGAGAQELAQVFANSRHRVLPSISRSVLQAGPDVLKMKQIAQEIYKELSNG